MPHKLCLLFYVEHFRAQTGGLENAAVQLCRGLAERGYDVHVLADDGDAADGVTVHADGLANRVRLEGRILPDLCLDWGFFHPAHVHRLGGGTHRGYLNYSLDAYGPVGRWFKRYSHRTARHRAIIAREHAILHNPQAQFMANSRLTADLAIADGANPERVTVHHNGVDTDFFRADRIAAERQAVRREWGLSERDVAFLFVAHNLRLKNLKLLLRVFNQLAATAGAKLVVVGKRPPPQVAPWLVYAGATGDMTRFYAAADVLLHPTFFDSCANVVLEAMACSLPVVISDTCGVNEIVRDGDDGRILQVRGEAQEVEQSWSAEIERLARDPVLRERRGRSARRLAEKHNLNDYLNWFDDYLRRVYKIKESEAMGR